MERRRSEDRTSVLVCRAALNGGPRPGPMKVLVTIRRASMIYTTGEKPGKGTYKCSKCGTTVRLDDNSDTLPPCPKCHGTKFVKIG